MISARATRYEASHEGIDEARYEASHEGIDEASHKATDEASTEASYGVVDPRDRDPDRLGSQLATNFHEDLSEHVFTPAAAVAPVGIICCVFN